MAAASETTLEPNITECAVCHDTFTDPKLLPCSHIMCRDCLVTWLKSQSPASCPLCRCAIVEPDKRGGRSIEEVADGFPTDLATTAMVEAETLLSKQHVCCVCVNVAAAARCLQCGDMYCQHCSILHRRMAISKHHEVEELNSLTTEKLAAYNSDTCPDHKEEVSKVYCPTHDTSLCMLCATTAHKNCPQLVSLQTKMGELTAELTQIGDNLAQTVAEADEKISALDTQVQELQRESEAAMAEMKTVCDRLKAAIDTRFAEVKNAAKELVSQITTKLIALKKSVMQKRSRMVTHKNLTELYTKFSEHKHFKDILMLVQIAAL